MVMVTLGSLGQQSVTAGLLCCRGNNLPTLALGWGQRCRRCGSWDQRGDEGGGRKTFGLKRASLTSCQLKVTLPFCCQRTVTPHMLTSKHALSEFVDFTVF